MSKGRTYYGIDEFSAINKKLGLKPAKPREKNYDEQKRKAQRAKFCKCGKCGGAMTFVPGTNSLICNNMVTKKKNKKQIDGSTKQFEVHEACGYVNIVDSKYTDYLNYLFDGVPADIAVTEASERKAKEDK